MFRPRITFDYFSLAVRVPPFEKGPFLMCANGLESDALAVQSFERYIRPGALRREFCFC
jgi:hypothetical protein